MTTPAGVIFDMDGTLLDSMFYWNQVPADCLRQIYGKEPKPDLMDRLKVMTLHQGCDWVRREYGLSAGADEIRDGINALMKQFYTQRVRVKDGARSWLEQLHKQDVPMVIATATDRDMIAAAMERLGLTDYFQGIITCGDLGMPKTQPDIYLYAAEKLGTRPEETLVFEDVAHAVRSAFSAGFPTISVYDKQSESEREEMRALSVLYLNSYSEWPGIR